MSQKSFGSGSRGIGELTRRAIDLMPKLGDRIVEEFKAEHYPGGQNDLRAAVSHALSAAISLAVADARPALESMSPEQRASLDEQVARFHLVESGEAVLALDGPGIKDTIIFVLEFILQFVPAGRIKTVVQFLLALLRRVQALGGGSSGSVLV